MQKTNKNKGEALLLSEVYVSILRSSALSRLEVWQKIGRIEREEEVVVVHTITA
jgi:hypothetical protein